MFPLVSISPTPLTSSRLGSGNVDNLEPASIINQLKLTPNAIGELVAEAKRVVKLPEFEQQQHALVAMGFDEPEAESMLNLIIEVQEREVDLTVYSSLMAISEEMANRLQAYAVTDKYKDETNPDILLSISKNLATETLVAVRDEIELLELNLDNLLEYGVAEGDPHESGKSSLGSVSDVAWNLFNRIANYFVQNSQKVPDKDNAAVKQIETSRDDIINKQHRKNKGYSLNLIMTRPLCSTEYIDMSPSIGVLENGNYVVVCTVGAGGHPSSITFIGFRVILFNSQHEIIKETVFSDVSRPLGKYPIANLPDGSFAVSTTIHPCSPDPTLCAASSYVVYFFDEIGNNTNKIEFDTLGSDGGIDTKCISGDLKTIFALDSEVHLVHHLGTPTQENITISSGPNTVTGVEIVELNDGISYATAYHTSATKTIYVSCYNTSNNTLIGNTQFYCDTINHELRMLALKDHFVVIPFWGQTDSQVMAIVSNNCTSSLLVSPNLESYDVGRNALTGMPQRPSLFFIADERGNSVEFFHEDGIHLSSFPIQGISNVLGASMGVLQNEIILLGLVENSEISWSWTTSSRVTGYYYQISGLEASSSTPSLSITASPSCSISDSKTSSYSTGISISSGSPSITSSMSPSVSCFSSTKSVSASLSGSITGTGSIIVSRLSNVSSTNSLSVSASPRTAEDGKNDNTPILS